MAVDMLVPSVTIKVHDVFLSKYVTDDAVKVSADVLHPLKCFVDNMSWFSSDSASS